MKGKITVVGPSFIPSAQNFDEFFRLYPNPVTDRVHLQAKVPTSSSNQPTNVEVYNLLGSKVYEMQKVNLSEATEINLGSLPAGHYILRICDEKYFYSRRITRK